MFKWKIFVYKNINGQEHKVEREFTNEKDFQEFVEKNKLDMTVSAKINFDPRIDLHHYVGELLNDRENLWNKFLSLKPILTMAIAKKPAVKKVAAKKPVAKKTVKKVATKKVATKKAPAKKVATKKVVAKKAPAKKVATKKVVAKKK